MANPGTCETCRCWVARLIQPGTEPPRYPIGWCNNTFDDRMPPGGMLTTFADYGCVAHEAKPDARSAGERETE